MEKQQECLDFLSGVRTAERAEGFFMVLSCLFLTNKVGLTGFPLPSMSIVLFSKEKPRCDDLCIIFEGY